MAAEPQQTPPAGALGLLERAIGYTRASLALVTSGQLRNPTPCESWTLYDLLRHMDDSLVSLQEAADHGYVSLHPAAGPDGHTGREPEDAEQLVDALRARACALLGAWTDDHGAELVSVAGCPITAGMLASTGAVEITVHGWDVARACGRDLPVPASMARDLLRVAPLLVSDDDRPSRFAPVVGVSPEATPGERLLAFLGRRP